MAPVATPQHQDRVPSDPTGSLAEKTPAAPSESGMTVPLEPSVPLATIAVTAIPARVTNAPIVMSARLAIRRRGEGVTIVLIVTSERMATHGGALTVLTVAITLLGGATPVTITDVPMITRVARTAIGHILVATIVTLVADQMGKNGRVMIDPPVSAAMSGRTVQTNEFLAIARSGVVMTATSLTALHAVNGLHVAKGRVTTTAPRAQKGTLHDVRKLVGVSTPATFPTKTLFSIGSRQRQSTPTISPVSVLLTSGWGGTLFGRWPIWEPKVRSPFRLQRSPRS